MTLRTRPEKGSDRFVVIGLHQLRLSYLVLLALAPVFLAGQQALLGQGLLVCNWF